MNNKQSIKATLISAIKQTADPRKPTINFLMYSSYPYTITHNPDKGSGVHLFNNNQK